MRNDIGLYDNIRKIVTVQGEDCTTGCLLNYPHLKNASLLQ